MTEPNPDFDKTDAVIARRLREIMPPADLRRRLLSLVPESPPRWLAWLICTGSAAVIAVVIIGTSFLSTPGTDAAVRDLGNFLNSSFELSVVGRPLPELQTWLARKGHPTATIPPALAAKIPEGCRLLSWNGFQASLICFETPSGVVHLVTFPAGTFRDLSASPRFVQSGPWTTAIWRSADADFLLFGESSAESMRQLL